ncbi:MAG: HAMP domain-containing sensor histidine kinase [Candidatus Thiodiazotropha sp.]
MSRSVLGSITVRQLRRWLTLFFLTLAIPSGVLVYQAYDQLKWEAFHRHRVLAEELAKRIDKRYAQLIDEEEKRAFVDYSFLNVAGDSKSNFVQLSPLSSFPVRSSIPGLIGYFQVDTDGFFKTPLLPGSASVANRYGIQADELVQRQRLADRVYSILSENRLVRAEKRETTDGRRHYGLAAPEQTLLSDEATSLFSSRTDLGGRRDRQAVSEYDEEVTGSKISEEIAAGQAAFDRLAEQKASPRSKAVDSPNSLGRVEDLQLDSSFQTAQQPQRQLLLKKKAKLEKRVSRKERGALLELESFSTPPAPAMAPNERQGSPLRIRTFESEIDPFEMSLLDSGHIVLYRKVWRESQRYIQGALIDQSAFLQGVVESSFRETSLAQMSDLIVADQGNVLKAFSATADDSYKTGTDKLRGALLHQTRLSAPLNEVELIFSIKRLPAGPGGVVIVWIAVILCLVLTGGFYGLYRLGVKQINLITQQQDFVSAVSHELKTPLTSIRMYGEMLREGWALEEKRHEYYDYIHDESERLTRLINNVLQLARMTRNGLDVQLKPVSADELLDTIRSKISSQVSRAGFALNLNATPDCTTRLLQVDPDYFTQIVINLVDNAIKFSTKAEQKAIDIDCRVQQDNTLVFRVRDYGPGIPKDQLKKIFKLFYRSESELTRETVGTGIGLALVKQLATAMQGKVDVVNVEPGAEFRVSFPVQ